MDHRTRLAALEKLDAMDVFVAYSDELFDDQKINDYYKDLEINRGSYLKGAFNISHFFTTQHYGTLRQPVDKQDWTSHKNAAVVNAYYYIQKNTFGRKFLLFNRWKNIVFKNNSKSILVVLS